MKPLEDQSLTHEVGHQASKPKLTKPFPVCKSFLKFLNCIKMAVDLYIPNNMTKQDPSTALSNNGSKTLKIGYKSHQKKFTLLHIKSITRL